jgi:hypothetical protein
MNEEQINALRYHNININKIIVLTDKDEEENYGKNLLQRKGFTDRYDIDNEKAIIDTATNVLKE